MKKTLLTLLSLAVISASAGIAYAKSANNSELVTAIRLYKAQDYTGSYSKLQTSIKRDPSNPLAYYYLAMVYSQLGNAEEAKANYAKTLNLASPGSNLYQYANKGKVCLEDADACQKLRVESDESFIRGSFGKGFSKKARGEYEKLKIENLMREMNRSDDIPAGEFREYRDFSSMNNEAVPTNDEIVAEIRTLQKAGLMNSIGNGYSDLSALTGNSPQQNAWYAMLGNSNQQINPLLIQSMLSNNMSFEF